MRVGPVLLGVSVFAAAAGLFAAPSPQQYGRPEPTEITIDSDDIEITGDVIVKPGTYRVSDENGNGVLIIKAKGITIDLGEAILVGAGPKTDPDKYEGFGIRVEDQDDVKITGGTIRGFKVGIFARDCRNLQITECEVTGNFRQHLKSTPEREDPTDWLRPHQNDENEWLEKYGAAIYLDRCTNASVEKCRGRNQQNGIILSRTEGSAAFDNDFSYHSGWGLAMWRSTGIEVARNKFDYCVRGYSHGVYHRGQDSAGILVFEQCTDNIFAFNSATHSGDGFFLYAGDETTKKTGEGGCNRNIVYGNDFSHAVANGIEATFSNTNMFVKNRMDECDYGIWAGYSYNSMFLGNRISRSLTAGIAIEHGNNNLIEGNTFDGDTRGIWLWWDEDGEILSGPFGKHQNTDSGNYRIYRNSFKDTGVGIQLDGTSMAHVGGNSFKGSGRRVREGQGSSDITVDDVAPGKPIKIAAPTTRGSLDALLTNGAPRGRETIVIDEWGPVDPTVLRLFPSTIFALGEASIRLMGPGGEFKVVAKGVKVTPETGTVPAELKISPPGPGLHEFELQVEVGDKTLSASGVLIASTWRVEYYKWRPQGFKKGPADWRKVIRGRPLAKVELDRIDLVWGRGAPAKRVPGDHFATLATTEIALPAGTYEFKTVSDDGVRLIIDGRKIIENWTWHSPTEDAARVPLKEGKHALRLEHFEIDGHAQLVLSIRKVE